MKITFSLIFGTIGSIFAYIFGGWDSVTLALCIFLLIDLITGFILAFAFHKSPKTQTGTAESRTMFKGLCRKGVILLFVGVGNILDQTLNVDYIKTGVAIAFMVEELISIVENAGLMGIPIPKIIVDSIDILKKKTEGEHKNDGT